MSKSFESNMAKQLKLKELATVAKRIEKYQSELEDTLNDRQKMLLNNLLCKKSKATAIIAMHCINKNKQSDQTQPQVDVRSLLSCQEEISMPTKLDDLYHNFYNDYHRFYSNISFNAVDNSFFRFSIKFSKFDNS